MDQYRKDVFTFTNSQEGQVKEFDSVFSWQPDQSQKKAVTWSLEKKRFVPVQWEIDFSSKLGKGLKVSAKEYLQVLDQVMVEPKLRSLVEKVMSINKKDRSFAEHLVASAFLIEKKVMESPALKASVCPKMGSRSIAIFHPGNGKKRINPWP